MKQTVIQMDGAECGWTRENIPPQGWIGALAEGQMASVMIPRREAG
jgi:hypothetical protein